MPLKEYVKASKGLIADEGCNDRFDNCLKMASDSCCSGRGRRLLRTCCASCRLAAEQRKCGGSGNNIFSLLQMAKGAENAELALKETGIYDPGFTQ
jgi:hypothetical protein